MNLQYLEEIKIMLDNAGNEIKKNLEEITIKLISLVESGEVLQFGFDSNINDKKKTLTVAYSVENTSCTIDVKPRLVLEINLKGNEKLLLGKANWKNVQYSHLNGFGKATITEETKQDINKISEYVEFVNSHISHFLPLIKECTNYSKENLQQNTKKLEPLLPVFLEHLVPKLEVKKAPKGFKH